MSDSVVLIGKLLAAVQWGCKEDDGLGRIVDSKLSCPAIVDNAILGVAPPSQDGLAVKGNFAKCFVK